MTALAFQSPVPDRRPSPLSPTTARRRGAGRGRPQRRRAFDADRRAVLAIQPDPGTGVRTAGKTTYDANGRTVQVDKGTTNAAGTVFTALETSTASYDPSGNKLAASVLNGPLGSAAPTEKPEHHIFAPATPSRKTPRLTPPVNGNP